MFIDTKYFGNIEIDGDQVINFPNGLPAFENIKEFLLILLSDSSPYFCLQSIKQPEAAFILIHPWDFFPEYDIDIPKEDMTELSIKKREQVQVYNIITIPHNPDKITANLLAPVVINSSNLHGKQIILQQGEYGTKHPLFRREVV